MGAARRDVDHANTHIIVINEAWTLLTANSVVNPCLWVLLTMFTHIHQHDGHSVHMSTFVRENVDENPRFQDTLDRCVYLKKRFYQNNY